jgi:hypothetical protein
MSKLKYEKVAQFNSKAEAEGAFQALEHSGFSYKRLFVFRAEDPSSLNDSRRHLRKCIAAGVLLGCLFGSWTGKALVFISPLVSLLGGGQAAERGLATLEWALIAGALGAVGGILSRGRLRPSGEKSEMAAPSTAPFRLEVRGTPEDASRAQTVLESRQQTRTAA